MISFFAPSPIDIMEITAATPKIIPNVVKKDLNTLCPNDSNAIFISLIIIII